MVIFELKRKGNKKDFLKGDQESSLLLKTGKNSSSTRNHRN